MHSMVSNDFNVFILVLILISISSSYGLHSISKRLQIPSIDSKNIPQIRDSILDRFHINANTIIRTHDSRALGAKYLNETGMPSNEDCLYWCWETSPCNLAVYDQKSRGSCYLFDCGSNEDFRCKFTAHSFYTSSILQVNRHPFDLNQWRSQVQHEKELTKLRVQSTVTPIPSSTAPSARNLMVPSMVPTTTANTLIFKKTSHCLHYQFECRNNSECIAIYNVCDGIPQCSDGSDEAIDLECHKSRFNVPNPNPSHSITQSRNSDQNVNNKAIETTAQKPEKSSPMYARVSSNKSPQQVMPIYSYSKTVDSENIRSPGDQSVVSKKHNFDSMGESIPKNTYSSQYRGPWNQYYNQNDGYNADNRQNGGTGLLVDSEYMNGYNNHDTSNSGAYWPPLRQQSFDLSDQMLSPGGQTYMKGSQMSNKPQTNSDVWPQSSGNTNNYDSNYYDRISRTRITKPESIGHSVPQEMSSNPKMYSNPKQLEIDSNINLNKNSLNSHKYEQQLKYQSQGKDDSTKAQVYNKPKTSYSHISSSNGYANSPRIVAVSYMRDSGQQNGRETNSAVIALTLGLLVTALLIVLVGCRMKSFKKKMARRGRSLAHDADYLVNGMYL